MPTLLTLPKELQLQIAEYVRKQKSATSSATATNRDQFGLKADLKNLCLVCKEMRDVGTPVLYKDMVVHVNKLDKYFQQVIKTTKSHHGLPHVRSLLIIDWGWENRMFSGDCEILFQLLSTLPRDSLNHFQ
jgi:hypothetical protein